jgi:hypothetical protein
VVQGRELSSQAKDIAPRDKERGPNLELWQTASKPAKGNERIDTWLRENLGNPDRVKADLTHRRAQTVEPTLTETNSPGSDPDPHLHETVLVTWLDSGSHCSDGFGLMVIDGIGIGIQVPGS